MISANMAVLVVPSEICMMGTPFWIWPEAWVGAGRAKMPSRAAWLPR
jgi:hypothetical protein